MSSEYKTLATLSGHHQPVNSFAFNGTGTRLASGGDDGYVMIWDITKPAACKIVQTIREPYQRWGQITTVTFAAPRGSAGYPIESIVFGTGRGYLCMWREEKSGGLFEEVHGEAHLECPVEALACDPNDRLVTTGHDGTVDCFDISKKTWNRIWQVRLHGAIPRAVTFDITGSSVNIFALESGEHYTFATDSGTLQGLRQLKGPVGYAHMSPDGQRVLVDTISGPFEIYSVSANALGSSSPVGSLRRPRSIVPAKNMIKQGVFAEDGKVAVCGSLDGRIFVYFLGREQPEIMTEVMPSQILNHETSSAIQTVATFSLREKHLIVSAPTQENADITIWGRDRVVGDAPLLLETDASDDSVPGALTDSPPPPEIDPAGLLGLIIILTASCVWYFGFTVNDIVKSAHNITQVVDVNVRRTVIALVGERLREAGAGLQNVDEFPQTIPALALIPL